MCHHTHMEYMSKKIKDAAPKKGMPKKEELS
jgi:hypothetical protein